MIASDVIARDESTSLLADTLHEFLIYSIELMVLESIAVGGIRDSDPLRSRATDIVTNCEYDIMLDPSSLGISLRNLYHLRIDITRCDRILATRVDLAQSVISDFLQEFTVMESEFLYSVFSL